MNGCAGRGWANNSARRGNWSRYAPTRSQSLPQGRYAGSGDGGGANTQSHKTWESAWNTSSEEPSQSGQQSTWGAQMNELSAEEVSTNEASISSASVSSLSPVGLLVQKKMSLMGLSGCGSCLSPRHQFDGNYAECRDLCPCCGISLEKNDHLAIDCDDKPRDNSEAVQLARQAAFNGDLVKQA